jgi:hypothetical protein
MTRVLVAMAVCLGLMGLLAPACTAMPNGPREICSNGIDDDKNGKIDCADPDCAGQPACFGDAGFFGACGKCGMPCANQTQCLTTSYFNDVPLPYCESGKCVSLAKNVQVDVILNAQQAWGTLISQTRSIATRFIKRTATDGSPVTCSVIEAAASGRTAAQVQQLENTGKFSYLGIDVRPINSATGSIPLRFLNVLTGSDYLIWMEMWGGAPDSTSKFPTGNRFGYECFDGPQVGQQWSPITENDNCPAPGVDGGTVCRQYGVVAVRGPQP